MRCPRRRLHRRRPRRRRVAREAFGQGQHAVEFRGLDDLPGMPVAGHHRGRASGVRCFRRCRLALAGYVGGRHFRHVRQLQDGDVPDLGHQPREHAWRILRLQVRHACRGLRRLHGICAVHVRAVCASDHRSVLCVQGRWAFDRRSAWHRPDQPPHGLHRQVVHAAGNLDLGGVHRRVCPDRQREPGYRGHDRGRRRRFRAFRSSALPTLRAPAYNADAQEGALPSCAFPCRPSSPPWRRAPSSPYRSSTWR